VIYDAIEAVAPVLIANYPADLAAIAAAKIPAVPVLPTAGGIDATINLYKYLDAESFATVEQNLLPGLGLDWENVLTQARRADRRDHFHYLVADYFARGTDATILGKQIALAAEALLHRIDQIASSVSAASGVYGAGEADLSIRIEQYPMGGFGQDTYEGRFRIHFPVQEEDTGLT